MHIICLFIGLLKKAIRPDGLFRIKMAIVLLFNDGVSISRSVA
jgi:hypothetical protein